LIAALRILPIINKERKKHETRKEFLAKINRHYKEGEKIINRIRKQLGYNDPIINKFEMVISSYQYDGKESFLRRFQLEGNKIPVG
jgi:ABC-type microcin C transport system permease subunit YejB